jgi:GNAT superfamily N-acetyltransferase
MKPEHEITIRPVETADASRLTALYGAAEAPCHCRYWHFAGDKNEWLERCFLRPEENRHELDEALAAGRDDALGVVAESAASTEAQRGDPGAGLVGWCKVTPAPAIPKAYEQRFYRGLDCFGGERASVWFVGCVLVHPAYRKRGLSERLVRGAVELARSLGASAVEAFPRRVCASVADGELWMGPAGAFERAGFAPVGGEDPYPVLRTELVPSSALRRRGTGGEPT